MDLGEDTCLFFWLVMRDSAFLERDENLAALSPVPGPCAPKLGSASIDQDGSDPPTSEELFY